MTENEKQLNSAPLGGLFLRYALPGVIGLLFYGIQTIIDGIIIGNYVGPSALASVNLILPCYSAAAVLAIMLGIGSQTIVSISFGQQDYQRAKDAITTGFVAILVTCVTFAILFYVLAEPIVILLGADATLIGDSVQYLHGLMPFFPAIAFMFYSDYMLKAMGHPRFAMAIMTSVVGLNVGLSLLFVITFQMGTFGVAMATGISFALGAIVSGMITFNPRNIISMLAGKFRFKLLWKMAYNGSSEGVSEMAAAVSILIINLALMKYVGAEGVAAYTAISYTCFVGITIFLGISDGIIPIISYNFGAKNRQRVFQTLKIAARTNAIIGVTLFLLLTFFSKHVIALFFSGGDQQVMELAVNGARIIAFTFLLNGLNILTSSFFTAIGNAKMSVITAALRSFVFVACGIATLPSIFGLNGVWMTIPIAEVLTASIAFTLLWRQLKRM